MKPTNLILFAGLSLCLVASEGLAEETTTIIDNGDFESSLDGFLSSTGSQDALRLNTATPLSGNASLETVLEPYHDVYYLFDPTWNSGTFFNGITTEAAVLNQGAGDTRVELCALVAYQNGQSASACDALNLAAGQAATLNAYTELNPALEVDRVMFRFENVDYLSDANILLDDVMLTATGLAADNDENEPEEPQEDPDNAPDEQEVVYPDVPANMSVYLDSSFEHDFQGFTSTVGDTALQLTSPGIDGNGSLRVDLPGYHRLFFTHDFPWDSGTTTNQAMAYTYIQQLSDSYSGALKMCFYVALQSGNYGHACQTTTDEVNDSGELLHIALATEIPEETEVDRLYFSIQNVGGNTAELMLDNAFAGLVNTASGAEPGDPQEPPEPQEPDPQEPGESDEQDDPGTPDAPPADTSPETDLSWVANIPQGHPRILFTEQDLPALRAWHDANPFEPGQVLTPGYYNFDPAGNAFKYLLTGDSSYAETAITGMMRAVDDIYAELELKTCNTCRWYGQEVVLTYDWLYDYLTQAQRDYVSIRLTATFEQFLDTYWGSVLPQFDENNFFWGYFRNAVLWGVADHHHNAKSAMFLQRALSERWEGMGIEHFNVESPSGIPAEGANYGPMLWYYKNVVQATLQTYGRDLHQETDWYRNGAWSLLYSALPKLTWDNPNSQNPGWTVFPYGDTGGFYAGNAQLNPGIRHFTSYALSQWNNTGLEGYLRTAVERASLDQDVPFYLLALDDGGETLSHNDLPTDYFIDGELAYAYTKSSWQDNASIVNLQLASPNPVGHEHLDSGNWQLWKDGVWVSRESPARGYGSTNGQIPGYRGEGQVNVESPLAHNVLLVDGAGPGYTYEPTGTVTDATSEADYFYASVDLSDAYNSSSVSAIKRNFLFIKPLEALLILDDVAKNDPASTVSFIAHFQQHPVVSGSHYYASNRHVESELVTLLPQSDFAVRVVNEQRETRSNGTPFDNAHRLVVDTQSSELLLHAISAEISGGPALQYELAQTATEYRITIVREGTELAEVIVDKATRRFTTLNLGAEQHALPAGIELMEPTNDTIEWSNSYIVTH